MSDASAPFKKACATETRLQHAEQLTKSGEGGLFIGVFTLFTRNHWRNWLQHSLARFIVFPLVAAGSLVEIILALYDYYQAKNKSIHKLGTLLLKLTTGFAVMTAVIGSVVAATTFAILTPALLAGSLALTTLYHSGMLIFHLMRGAWAKKIEAPTAVIHHQKAKEHAVSAVINLTLTAGTTLLMLLKIPALIMTIAAGVSAFTAFVGTVLGVKATLAKRVPANSSFLEKENTDEEGIPRPLIRSESGDMEHAETHRYDFYYRAHRTQELQQRLTASPTEKTIAEAKAYLIEEITDKIKVLYAQLEAGKPYWLERRQATTRFAKIEVLNALLVI